MTLEKLRELSDLMSGLQQELVAATEEHAQEMLRELEAGFASLSDSGEFSVSSSANSIFVDWEFLSYESITFQISAPFSRYQVFNSDQELIDQFDSLPEMVTVVRSWASDAINLALTTRKVLPSDRGFELERICLGRSNFGESAPGFSALHFFSPGEKNKLCVDRSIEIAVGPFDMRAKKGFYSLSEGESSILLSRREDGESRVVPYLFDSAEEAIAWLSEHLDDLSNPEEFDAACKE